MLNEVGTINHNKIRCKILNTNHRQIIMSLNKLATLAHNYNEWRIQALYIYLDTPVIFRTTRIMACTHYKTTICLQNAAHINFIFFEFPLYESKYEWTLAFLFLIIADTAGVDKIPSLQWQYYKVMTQQW